MLDWMSLGHHEYLILFGYYHIIIFNGYYVEYIDDMIHTIPITIQYQLLYHTIPITIPIPIQYQYNIDNMILHSST